MKITKRLLQQLIKEELQNVQKTLSEGTAQDMAARIEVDIEDLKKFSLRLAKVCGDCRDQQTKRSVYDLSQQIAMLQDDFLDLIEAANLAEPQEPQDF